MAKPFVFQQFSLEQPLAAFKLGTDSVALGCWLPVEAEGKVLDIGAGTGILSLIMAQRFSKTNIKAIETDEDSYKDCANNFSQSPWKQNLLAEHADMVEWSKEHPGELFDLVITNPPYFTGSLKGADPRKNTARHTDSLPLQVLAEIVSLHLSAGGMFAFVLPVDAFEKLSEWLKSHGIFPRHICDLRSYAHTGIIRKMGVFSRVITTTIQEDRYLYEADGSRSVWYNSITDTFYLKK